MGKCMPERIDNIGAAPQSGTDQMDRPAKDKPAGIVIGPCTCGKNVSHAVDPSDRGFMRKLSDKFFRYLRNLAH